MFGLRKGAVLLFALLSCSDAMGQSSFSYDDYARVLLTNVDSEGLVNYQALKSDRNDLDKFVARMAALDRKEFDGWPEAHRLAFWINAYNALTLRLIVDNYPIESSALKSLAYPRNSIRQIDGAWDQITFNVMGEDLTLDYIEHKILRAQFNDPRIHVALVCAALSCPPLRRTPYRGDDLKEQLDEQARTFLSRSNGMTIDRERSEVRFSAIFQWFAGDFVEKYANPPAKNLDEKTSAVINFAVNNIRATDAAYLRSANYVIKHFDYDWALNERKP